MSIRVSFKKHDLVYRKVFYASSRVDLEELSLRGGLFNNKFLNKDSSFNFSFQGNVGERANDL